LQNELNVVTEKKPTEAELKDMEFGMKVVKYVKSNATLREYQVEGYKWLKTLDYLGFGGILGDEMGLGKTLQTITFITSNKDKRSLIVAPTSLIYNWKDEFRRFSPDIKVAIVNGGIKERE
ncbi:ATP-dependent helicase, partial [Clostridium saudiense]|nr:ATP-dependent helicase [Clostridium saudiense]